MAKKVFDALMATGHWGEVEAKLGIEFDFKCAYCCKDLLSTVDNYKEWQTEHIIPSSKGGDDSPGNYALTCRTCNFIKGVWNPMDYYQGQLPAKHELIALAQNYIQSKRKETQTDISLYRKLIVKYS